MFKQLLITMIAINCVASNTVSAVPEFIPAPQYEVSSYQVMESRVLAYGSVIDDTPIAPASENPVQEEFDAPANEIDDQTEFDAPASETCDQTEPEEEVPEEEIPAEEPVPEEDPLEQRIQRLKSEYPEAGRVYEYLQERGWSDACIAGVLGNMMSECGGHTLALQVTLYDSEHVYYGACQWSLRYNACIAGASLDEQLDYLISTIEHNMAYFGGDFHIFLTLESATEAASYFCNYYEIGAGEQGRMNNAAKALNWILK